MLLYLTIVAVATATIGLPILSMLDRARNTRW
jgi:hypothetical protein